MTPEPLASPAADAPEAVPAPDAIGPRLYGVIDAIRADRIAGWAIDRADDKAALDIDILREGRLIRTVRADRHRADLEKGGIGTGAYGFRVEIAPPLEPGFEFTLAVFARAPDGARAELKRVGAAATPLDPAARVNERIFEAVSRLGASVARLETQPGAARLNESIERLELVQARIEAALGAIDAPPAPVRDRGLARMVHATLVVALASLGAGLWSLWAG